MAESAYREAGFGQLQRSKLVKLLDHCASGVAMLSSEFEYEALNIYYARRIGRTPNECIGRSVFAVTPGSEPALRPLLELAASGEIVHRLDFPLAFEDQPERGMTYWDFAFEPFYIKSRLTGILVMMHEVTERHRDRERIGNLVERLQGIQEAVAQVWQCQVDHLPAHRNQVLARFCRTIQAQAGLMFVLSHPGQNLEIAASYGLDPQTLTAFVRPDRSNLLTSMPEQLCPAGRSLLEGAIIQIDSLHDPRVAGWVRRFLGPLDVTTILSVPLTVGSQPLGCVSAYFRQSLHLNQELASFVQAAANLMATSLEVRRLIAEPRNQARQAEEESRQKSQFLSAASHDLRAPLHTITLSTNLLRQTLGSRLGAAEAEHLETIVRAAQTANDLVRNLLDIHRVESGRVDVVRGVYPLAPILHDLARGMQPQAEAKGLSFAWDPASAAGLWIETDEIRFKQVVLNLLTNAVRYTERGAVDLRVGRDPDGGITIAVSDTGPGIAAEDRERIFDEFYQVGNPARGVSHGTGLGLALARRLAGHLDLEIGLTSELGRGSTFSIRVSPGQVVLRETGSSTPAPPPAPTVPRGGRVLIVEDDADARSNLRLLLKHLGYDCSAAAQGQEALETVRTVQPQVILMDMLMPVMGGLEAVRKLKSQPETAAIPVVALTGDVSQPTLEATQAAGFVGWLEKPLNIDDLITILNRLIPSP